MNPYGYDFDDLKRVLGLSYIHRAYITDSSHINEKVFIASYGGVDIYWFAGNFTRENSTYVSLSGAFYGGGETDYGEGIYVIAECKMDLVYWIPFTTSKRMAHDINRAVKKIKCFLDYWDDERERHITEKIQKELKRAIILQELRQGDR